MKRLTLLLTTIACLALGGFAPAATASDTTIQADEAEWIVKKTDHICGLSNPKTLSNPAKVDYAKLLAATPEIKKIKKDEIDPNSPEGVQLRTQAATRVANACETVRAAKSHCSVWKTIRNKDNRAIVDLTAAVKAKL